MKPYKVNLIFLALFFLFGCTKKIEVGDFDSERWVADRQGCNGNRVEMIDDVIKIKENLLGLYQKSVIKVLGKPEGEELYERSQTYWWYYIDPSGECANANENPRKLTIRYTALGIANQVDIE
uniref:hypothetical protein n=1 Tax=Roseivirga sp. TaxID=1964215 RepID=UPI004047B73B